MTTSLLPLLANVAAPGLTYVLCLRPMRRGDSFRMRARLSSGTTTANDTELRRLREEVGPIPAPRMGPLHRNRRRPDLPQHPRRKPAHRWLQSPCGQGKLLNYFAPDERTLRPGLKDSTLDGESVGVGRMRSDVLVINACGS